MCINPIKIKNPNKGLNVSRYHVVDGVKKPLYNFLKDCKSDYINVPCGHCPECIAIRQMSIVQRVQTESVKNHIFFCTLTYSEEMIPRYVDPNTGWIIKYADFSDFVNMVKRIRKSGRYSDRDLRYFVVSELGSSHGRPHFHVLWFLNKRKDDDYTVLVNLQNDLYKYILSEWKRNVSDDWRHPVYKPLCKFIFKKNLFGFQSTYDLHLVMPTVDDVSSNVAFYVSKYMVKPSDRAVRLQRALSLNLEPEEYDSVWKVVRPRWQSSRGFGLNGRKDEQGRLINDAGLVDYVKNMVEKSKSYPSPRYMADNGSVYPLSRFYANNLLIYSMDDRVFFHDKPTEEVKRAEEGGLVYTSKVKDNVQIQNVIDSHNRKLEIIESHDKSSLFNQNN